MRKDSNAGHSVGSLCRGGDRVAKHLLARGRHLESQDGQRYP